MEKKIGCYTIRQYPSNLRIFIEREGQASDSVLIQVENSFEIFSSLEETSEVEELIKNN